MATSRIQGALPDYLTDLESLAYCAVSLSGCTLPWAHAVSRGWQAGEMAMRAHMRQHPHAECLRRLPPAVHAFVTAVLRAGGTRQPLQPDAAVHLLALQGGDLPVEASRQ